MNIKVYNREGKIVGETTLPSEIFDLKMNPDLVQQAYLAQLANSRKVIASVKDRGERRGGGRKPWRQKGTGRARVGSIRSPLWRKGGITFGPRPEKTYYKKINKKMKRKALFMVLSSKVRDKELIVLDKLELAKAKTKEMVGLLAKLPIKKKSTLVILPKKDEKLARANRNIPYAEIRWADSLNVVDLLNYKFCLMSKEAVEVIKKTYLKE